MAYMAVHVSCIQWFDEKGKAVAVKVRDETRPICGQSEDYIPQDSRDLSIFQSRVAKQWQTSFLVSRPETAMGASSVPRLSGMQKQVLALYRGFLRAARSKPAEERRQIESLVSAEFHKNSKQVDRKNFIYIEYLLRRGKKQLDQLKSPDIVGLSSLSVDSSQTRNSSS